MNLKRRATALSRIVLMLLQKERLAGAKVTKAHRGARHLSLGLRLIDPTELDKAIKLSEAIAMASNSDNVLAHRQAGLILYQFQLAQGYWESYTRSDLPSSEAVGLAEQRKPVNFKLDPPHSLIAGTTGSGKSETVKSIILSLMTTYTPDDMGLILIDPNRDYIDLTNSAHLIMPIAHEQDEIRTALAYANRELLKNRIPANNRDGKRLIVAIDEAESDIALGDKVNLTFAQNIAKKGRAFKVNLIVSTQEPKEKNLEGFLGQLLNRFVGTVRDARESALFTGHAGLSAHKLTGKGDFLHVVGAEYHRFQVAQVTQRDFDHLERAEVKKPFEDVSQDLIILPDEVDNVGGRPSLEVSPITAARYFWHNPYEISRSMAAERFGLTRTAHNLHKNFTIEFTQELKRLRSMR